MAVGEGLTVTVRSERGVIIAAITGDIDISTVTRLRERLLELADSGRTLIVDLNRVTFIDSVGLGTLVGAAHRAAGHGGSLYAVCARPATRKLLWLTGVNRRIPLAATLDGALMIMAASQDAPGERSADHNRPGPYRDDAGPASQTLTTWLLRLRLAPGTSRDELAVSRLEAAHRAVTVRRGRSPGHAVSAGRAGQRAADSTAGAARTRRRSPGHPGSVTGSTD